MGAIILTEPSIADREIVRHEIIGSDRCLVPAIQFNVIPQKSDAICMLNDIQHVNSLQDRTLLKRLLRMHGLFFGSRNTVIREYRVFVFQTQALITYVSNQNSLLLLKQKKRINTNFQRINERRETKEVKKVQQFAIRTLYSLGLDYGLVTCGIGAGKNQVVLDVNVSPICDNEMERKIVQAIMTYSEGIFHTKENQQILLGADPEFIIKSPKGHLVLASNYFPMKGKVGCDAIWLGQNRKDKPLFELRPEPTSDPRKLVIRIYEGLLLAAKKVSHVSGKWLAGNMPVAGLPLGGHIHFSGIKPDFKLLRALDNYLALPLILAEDESGIKRRPNYGYLGDYRLKHYGGFEYRTLPSWLVSPILTKGAFAIAKCVAHNYQRLQYKPLGDINIQEAYYSGEKNSIRYWIDLLWSDLYALDDYQQHAQYLDQFFYYLQAGRKWNEKLDFRKSWRIPPYKN